MDRVLSCEKVREVDRRAIEDFGMSGLVLMENAGRGIADRLCHLMGYNPCQRSGTAGLVALKDPAEPEPTESGSHAATTKDKVVICCGRGNNAGDGFVIARHLDLRGFEVRVLLWADPDELRGDAEANFRIVQKSLVPVHIFTNQYDPVRFDEDLGGATWVVDALLGTGSRGAPRPPLDKVIEHLNASGIPILAVDVPSGLNCDTGQAFGLAIQATVTCTFVAAKSGFLAPEAQRYVGRLEVLDIGAPRKLIEEVLGQR